MTTARIFFLLALAGLGLPEIAWAHHPGPGAAGPWASLALLVIGLALVVIWPVLAFLEKRQKPTSKRRRSPKR